MPTATRVEIESPSLERLTEKFPVEVYRKNPKGFTYIPIEQMIRRFNDVLGAGWSLVINKTDFQLMPGMTYGRQGKPAALAIVSVEINAEMDGFEVTRSGVGADYGAADDPDKLVKTALAEAIKKCGNEYGIGLELWDEEERELIDAAQSQGVSREVVQANSRLDTLKNRVADIAVAQGAERTGPAIAAHFGVTVEELQDEAKLEAIVAQEAGSFA